MFLLHVDREERCNRKRFVSIDIFKIAEYSDVKTSDIFITLNETAAENWSFGQGIAQMVKIKGEKMKNELIEVHIKRK